MAAKKLMFVSKDIGGAGVAIPLARIAREEGFVVDVVTEGLASGKYEEAGFSPGFKGTVNFIKEPFSLDPRKFIEQVFPDVIITTLGSPINLENSFGLAANVLGIPLVFLEDFWGAHIRSEAIPDLVLSIDEIGVKLAEKRYGFSSRAEAVGNYAVNKTYDMIIPDEIKKAVEGLRNKFGRVFVFTANGAHVSEQLMFLKECLRRTSDWCLIPRFHPKTVNLAASDGRTNGECWMELLEEFGDRLVHVESKTTDPLAALADATLSDFSTLLTVALVFGHPAISVVTPGVRETMRSETGFTSHPMVEWGLVKEVTEPGDLAGYLNISKNKSDFFKPYDPSKALLEINNLFV